MNANKTACESCPPYQVSRDFACFKCDSGRSFAAAPGNAAPSHAAGAVPGCAACGSGAAGLHGLCQACSAGKQPSDNTGLCVDTVPTACAAHAAETTYNYTLGQVQEHEKVVVRAHAKMLLPTLVAIAASLGVVGVVHRLYRCTVTPRSKVKPSASAKPMRSTGFSHVQSLPEKGGADTGRGRGGVAGAAAGCCARLSRLLRGDAPGEPRRGDAGPRKAGKYRVEESKYRVEDQAAPPAGRKKRTGKKQGEVLALGN